MTCKVTRCGEKAKRRGYCTRHYQRLYRHGDPLGGGTAKTPGRSREYRRQWVIQYKLRHGCADCGYRGHHAALDFDRRPGTVKVRDIKTGGQLGWVALRAEVAKCDVVCANCHRIRTFERRQEEVVTQ